MTPVRSQPEIGLLLREWRRRRRVTQLELALDAGISARHLSFVETGHSQPGRDMLLRVLEQLKVPFREQNRFLLAAGHAPAYPERSFGDPDLAPVRDALDLILSGHDPYPAVIRVGLHPRGLGPLFVNLGDWHAHWLKRLEGQLMATGDEQLAALIDEVAEYPVPEHGAVADEMLGPVRVRAPNGGELAFFGMFATFDTPFEVTTSELAVELLFPADRATAEALQDRESSASRR